MNDVELEFARVYLNTISSLTRRIEDTRNDRDAPIDATRPLEGSLKAIREDSTHLILEILLRDAVNREQVIEPPTEIER